MPLRSFEVCSSVRIAIRQSGRWTKGRRQESLLEHSAKAREEFDAALKEKEGEMDKQQKELQARDVFRPSVPSIRRSVPLVCY